VLEFKTKKAAVEHFRKYLHESDEWKPLQGKPLDDLIELIERHPSKEEKIGCGIAAVYVRRNPMFPSQRSFWIRRNDGTETDFSYLRCIDGKDKPARHWFNAACRYAVQNQILDFKRRAFLESSTVTCEITGSALTWKTCHVDHSSPRFEDLVAAFISKRGLTQFESLYEKDSDGECEVKFTSLALTDDWRAYHAGNAKLRIISVQANLKRKRAT
jgi:hypothetical protein